jgi:predicted small lipoprotein YifL
MVCICMACVIHLSTITAAGSDRPLDLPAAFDHPPKSTAPDQDYSFGSSAPFVPSPRVAADLFSSLPPGGPPVEPPEPNIWV